MKTLRPCLAELLGTFFVCFAGIAAILSNTPEVGGMPGLLGIARPWPGALGGGQRLRRRVGPALQPGGHRARGQERRARHRLDVAFDILAGGTVTGASMTPARSFGPALEMMRWDSHRAYWVAPVAGACAAALLCEHVLLRPMKPAVGEPRAMRA